MTSSVDWILNRNYAAFSHVTLCVSVCIVQQPLVFYFQEPLSAFTYIIGGLESGMGFNPRL